MNSILTKDKVVYSLQAFQMFLNIAKDSQVLKLEEIEHFKEKSISLLEELVSDRLDPLNSAFQLNALIEEMNQSLPAPYPSLIDDTQENLVKGEIVAFEHYLNQELKAKHLTAQQEAPLFNDSLMIWEQVGVSLSAKEGISAFSAIVEKLNRLVPEDEHYPLPDETQY